MPSFYENAAFLFRALCLPSGILFVCYFAYSVVRHRFENSLEELCRDYGANLFIAIPDVLQGFLFLTCIPLWIFSGVRAYQEMPRTLAKLRPAFEKILHDTRLTSAVERFYVPSKGSQVTTQSESEIPLGVTYWLLGLRRFHIALPDGTAVQALLSDELEWNQAQQLVESEPLLLTPVSNYYFSGSSLQRAKDRSRLLTASTMLDFSSWHMTPFEVFRVATRRLGFFFIPLLAFAAFLRWLQIQGLREALRRDTVPGLECAMLATRKQWRIYSASVSSLLGATPGRVKAGGLWTFFLTATPYRMEVMAPVRGKLVSLAPLPYVPIWLQIGFILAALVKPFLSPFFLLAFLSAYQHVFLPDFLLSKIQARKDSMKQAG